MKKYLKSLFLINLSMFLFAQNVNAIEDEQVNVNLSGYNWSGGTIDRYEDDNKEPDQYIISEFWLDDGRAAYCLEYGAPAKNGSAQKTDLKIYLKQGVTDESKLNELVSQINKYLYFGYGTEGKISETYYIATQKLLWELLSKSGFYKSEYYKENYGEYNFKTLSFKYRTSGETIDLTKEIAAIEKSIKDYETKPSLCSMTKEEIELNKEISFEDTNKVLSNYKLSCSEGLNCKVDGNNLKITATSEGKNKEITFTKEKQGTPTAMYKDGKSQGIVIAQGEVGELSCSFKVDTFLKPETSDTNVLLILVIGIISSVMVYITYNSAHKQEI